MTEYEHLISDAPIHSNFYPYGDATGLTPQQLYFAILVEETCNRLGVHDIAAAVSIVAGWPLLSTRAKLAGTTKGTSIASRISRELLDCNVSMRLPTLTLKSMRELRFAYTRNLGAFVGRWVPGTGYAMTAYDVIAINMQTLRRYNRLVKPEDQINDLATGTLG